MLQLVPELEKFLFAVKDQNKKILVQKVIKAFETEVLANLALLEKGNLNYQLIFLNFLKIFHDIGYLYLKYDFQYI